MDRPMRQHRRRVTDWPIICAMLDRMDTMYLGMNDGPAPYVVPLSFGYEWNGDLVFFFHCAREGHKKECLMRDPNVCVTASSFISYAKGSVRGHLHDYRSVIARGVAQRIDPQQEAKAFRHAMGKILEHNGRAASDADTPVMRYVDVWRVVCRAQDVTAKAEIPPRSVDEVPFSQKTGDGVPCDDSHILEVYRETRL